MSHVKVVLCFVFSGIRASIIIIFDEDLDAYLINYTLRYYVMFFLTSQFLKCKIN